MTVEKFLGKPGTPYARAVKANGFLFFPGGVGVHPDTGQVVAGGIREQTRQTLDNLKALLEEFGSSLEKVVKVTVYLTNMDDFPGMNEVYKQYFPEPPVRTTVGVSALAGSDFLIEIDLVAAL